MVMNREIRHCPIEGQKVNIYRCKGHTCDTCPEYQLLQIKDKDGSEKFNNPISLANAYLNNEICLSLFDVETIFNDPELNTLAELNLENDIEIRIFTALFEFSRAVYYYEKTKGVVKKHNEKIVKKRKDTIKYLNKILEIDYPFLPNETTECLHNTLKRLKRYDEMKINYHALSDLYFISNIAEVKSFETINPILDELVIHSTVSQKKKQGRQSDIFLKALMVVVCRLLTEKANLPIMKAYEYTSKIINEYFEANEYFKEHQFQIDKVTTKIVEKAVTN